MGNLGTVTLTKKDDKWTAEVKVRAHGKSSEQAITSMFKALESTLDTQPPHGYGCECSWCEIWKERDAVQRLGAKNNKAR